MLKGIGHSAKCENKCFGQTKTRKKAMERCLYSRCLLNCSETGLMRFKSQGHGLQNQIEIPRIILVSGRVTGFTPDFVGAAGKG